MGWQLANIILKPYRYIILYIAVSCHCLANVYKFLALKNIITILLGEMFDNENLIANEQWLIMFQKGR